VIAGFNLARIRTIKPEFWTSEQIVECSPTTRLLFIGMWNFCDDHGIHPDSVKRLKMEVFPSDTISGDDIKGMVNELMQAKILEHYVVAEQGYWRVTGWSKHQKIEKPTYRHPLPSTAETTQKSESNHRPVSDSSPTPRVRNGMESNGSKPVSDKSDAIQILDHLNQKAGRNYRPVKANLSLIDARLQEGEPPDQCKAVIDAKVAEWSGNANMRKYLRPETLFNATKFASYVGELGSDGDRSNGVQTWE
jgi:uncharacterized phage protein (TIGR02220 family)